MNLRLEFHGKAAHLLIDRADKRNAITMEMWQAFMPLLAQVESNPEARVLVIRAAEKGGAFSAGSDINEMAAHAKEAHWRIDNQSAINRVQHRLARINKATIAFVEGDCIGAGCGLALACDMRVATVKARFGITAAKLGLVYPFHDVKLLTDLVGPGQARRMLYSGCLLDAEDAHAIGLCESVADSPDALVQACLEASPYAIRENKRMIQKVLDGQISEDAETAEMFARAMSMPDFLEGTRAFIEKRSPQFND